MDENVILIVKSDINEILDFIKTHKYHNIVNHIRSFLANEKIMNIYDFNNNTISIQKYYQQCRPLFRPFQDFHNTNYSGIEIIFSSVQFSCKYILCFLLCMCAP